MSEKTHKTVTLHKLRDDGKYYEFNLNASIPNQFFTFKHDTGTRCRIEDCSKIQRKKLFIDYWQQEFRRWKVKGYYQHLLLFLETSPCGLYHWHGIVLFDDAEKFNGFLGLYKYVHEKQCTIDVDNMESAQIWREYCQKDNKRIKYIYDSNHVLPHIYDEKDMTRDQITIYEYFLENTVDTDDIDKLS